MSRHFSFGGERCKVKCPKCKGQNLHMSEQWNGNSIEFTVKAGVMPDNADDHFAGAPVRVGAYCGDCNHGWTVRGARCIYDVLGSENLGAANTNKGGEA